MNTVDIILIIILTYGTWAGYKEGLLMAFINLTGFLIALVLALVFLDETLPYFKPLLGSGPLLPIVTILALTFGFNYLIKIGARSIKNSLRGTFVGELDCYGGAIFGLLKIMLLCGTLLSIQRMTGYQFKNSHTKDSFIYPVVVGSYPQAKKAIGYIMPFLRPKFESFKKKLTDKQ